MPNISLHADPWACMRLLCLSEQLTRILQCLFFKIRQNYSPTLIILIISSALDWNSSIFLWTVKWTWTRHSVDEGIFCLYWSCFLKVRGKTAGVNVSVRAIPNWLTWREKKLSWRTCCSTQQLFFSGKLLWWCLVLILAHQKNDKTSDLKNETTDKLADKATFN